MFSSISGAFTPYHFHGTAAVERAVQIHDIFLKGRGAGDDLKNGAGSYVSEMALSRHTAFKAPAPLLALRLIRERLISPERRTQRRVIVRVKAPVLPEAGKRVDFARFRIHRKDLPRSDVVILNGLSQITFQRNTGWWNLSSA